MIGATPHAAGISTVIAFDYGQRRIGVAVGNTVIDTATALLTLHISTHGPDWPAIDKLLKEWRPDLIIVGWPTLLDGTPSANSTQVSAFAEELRKRFGIALIMVDEKLSSAEAKDQIRASRQAGLRRKTQSGDVDKFAAEVILRTWLNDRARFPPGEP